MLGPPQVHGLRTGSQLDSGRGILVIVVHLVLLVSVKLTIVVAVCRGERSCTLWRCLLTSGSGCSCFRHGAAFLVLIQITYSHSHLLQEFGCSGIVNQSSSLWVLQHSLDLLKGISNSWILRQLRTLTRAASIYMSIVKFVGLGLMNSEAHVQFTISLVKSKMLLPCPKVLQ